MMITFSNSNAMFSTEVLISGNIVDNPVSVLWKLVCVSIKIKSPSQIIHNILFFLFVLLCFKGKNKKNYMI